MELLDNQWPTIEFGTVPNRVMGPVRVLAEKLDSQVQIRKRLAGLLILLVVSLLLQTGLFAQEFRATISGTVVDPSGAVIPGADIVVLEKQTGTINRTTSDSVGQYVVPYLLSGSYSITATKTGFETLVRGGVVLQAQEHPILNLVMTVGSESRTVTVTTEAPLLNQVNASVGNVIPVQSVEDLPLNGYNPLMLAELSVGLLITNVPSSNPAYNPTNLGSVGGTRSNEGEVLLDGAADTSMSGGENGNSTFVPTEDSVQEVSVQTFSTDASIGHTTAGVINLVTKGGTNELHGTAYEFSQISDLNSNLYFNKRAVPVIPTPVAHFNQYGLATGGPIWIPKVFNGKNKMFFFFAWEGIRTLAPVSTIITVPTDAEKEGDFSALLAGGSGYQLYEPNTGTLVNGAFTRTPVPNNCLTNKSSYCSSVANAGIAINPIAAAYMKFYPEPNYTSGVSPITNEDNYDSNAPNYINYSTEFGRLDFHLGARNHMFFDFRHDQSENGGQNYLNNNTTSSVLFRESYGTTLDDVFTMNPTTVFDVRLNWGLFDEEHTSPSNMYSPTSVGFPSSMTSASNWVTLPNVDFNSSSYEDMGDLKTQSIDPNNVYQIFIDVTKLVGRHTLKIGFDGRTYRQRIQSYAASTGSFTFGNSFVTSGTSGSAQKFGGDLASFEYGLPTSGSFGINALGDYRGNYIGTFIQDDWRVNKRLTLNLGLRFDIDTPFGEKFGRTEGGFNPSAVNSASAAAATAFVPSTKTVNDTTVTVSSIDTLGGLTFPSSDWGAPYQIENKTGFWSPRIGFSYSPPWFSKTVVRGGFGVFVEPQSLQGDSYSDGFSATTSYQATNNNYFTNLNTLTNPFPSGFTLPAGASQGANTFLGSPSTIDYFDSVEHDMYLERWTLGVQQAITGSTLVEAIYEGTHGVHLPTSSLNINADPLQYLTTNPYRDQNLLTALATSVTNPFASLLPLNSSYNGATTSLGNLVVPYPAFGSSAINEEQLTNGQSFFESGMLHVEQRAKSGLTLTANYEFSKTIEEDTYLNPEDARLFRGISPNEDYKQHFAVGGVYELPFGRGKLFSLGGGRLADEIAGGWVLNGIYQFQTGLPVNFSADIPFQPGMNASDIHINPRDTSPTSPALTNASSVFVTGSGTSCTVSASQPCDGTVFFNGQYGNHYRTMPTTFGNVRQDGFNNLDASMLKNFHFTEKAYLQLRFETFNTLNHAFGFKAPNVTSATSSSFGFITAQTAGNNFGTNRQVQLGGRLVF